MFIQDILARRAVVELVYHKGLCVDQDGKM